MRVTTETLEQIDPNLIWGEPNRSRSLKTAMATSGEHPCDNCPNRRECAVTHAFCDAYSHVLNLSAGTRISKKNWSNYSREPRHAPIVRVDPITGLRACLP